MPSTYSPNKAYELQATGENDGTWGVLLNQVLSQIDLNQGGRLAVTIDASNVDLDGDQTENVYIALSGTLTGNRDLTFPATAGGFFFVDNGTSGAFSVTAKPLGGSGVVVPQGSVSLVFINPTAAAAVLISASVAGVIPISHGGTGATSASGARTNLGLGTIATQNSNNVTITGGSITGITDLAVADGGTGASDASGARTNLGIAIGSDVQAYSARLTEIAALAVTDSNFIVGNGSSWVAETGSTARTSLGLGSIATQAANNVSITGGSITGITDLAVADGGTGASTAPNARTNLGLGTAATANIGTSGATVPLLNVFQTWGAGQVSLTADGVGSWGCSVIGPGSLGHPFITFNSNSFGTAVGSITLNGFGTLYNTTSDGGLKTNIHQFDPWEVLNSLNPVEFEWVGSKVQDRGFIAQEVHKIKPNAVTPARDGRPWSMDAGKFMPEVVAALKDLARRVTELETRLV